MGQIKRAVYWLMGDRGGQATIAVWNWLWGITETPAREQDDSQAPVAAHVATARSSLEQMQASVNQLTQAVAQQVSAYNKAHQTYTAKVKQIETLEAQAATAQAQGDLAAARLVMSQVIQLEQLLPQLEVRVRQTEEFLQMGQAKLERERIRLETFKIELQSLQEMAELDAALQAIQATHDGVNVESARMQFEAAREAIGMRYLEQQALTELSHGGQDFDELDRADLNLEIERRLAQQKNYLQSQVQPQTQAKTPSQPGGKRPKKKN